MGLHPRGQSYFDGDRHGFKIYVNDRYALMIYAGTAEVTEEVRARLNAGEDVRDFVDDDGNCVGAYIDVEEEYNDKEELMHYNVPGREKQPIELMYLGLTYEEFCGYCIGNVIKYILRYKHKGGKSDLYKAREYIDFMIRAYDDESVLGDDE